MDYKKTKAPNTTVTRDLAEFDKRSGNIYQSCVVVSKRANQISVEIKEELSKKLEEFASYTDNLEEIFENREQIEISKFYEKLPKASLISIQEFMDGKVYSRFSQSETELE